MTREERLDLLKQIEKDIYVPSIESTLLDDAKSCAIHSAIVELEKGPVLNKIRAEIQDIAFDWQEIDGEHESFMVVDLNDALNIIDKYKAESEPQADKEQEDGNNN